MDKPTKEQILEAVRGANKDQREMVEGARREKCCPKCALDEGQEVLRQAIFPEMPPCAKHFDCPCHKEKMEDNNENWTKEFDNKYPPEADFLDICVDREELISFFRQQLQKARVEERAKTLEGFQYKTLLAILKSLVRKDFGRRCSEYVAGCITCHVYRFLEDLESIVELEKI
jgi:hypothetical protein